MSANIPFSIASCSGEEHGYCSTELLMHSQDSRGWCTPRNCTYPQHLTLHLEQPANLQQIQLLSHEYKIAGKVEIQIASPLDSQLSQDVNSIPFTRLGYLSFDPNDRTHYSARELKSISLAVPEAQYIRFIFHRCHINSLNANNQVGIIMINIVGQPVPQRQQLPTALPMPTSNYTSPVKQQLGGGSGAGIPATLHKSPSRNNGSVENKTFNTAGDDFMPNMDVVTSQHVADLQRLKEQAVDREDYDEAKRLKAAIDKLKAVGEKIAELEARKSAAVANEDYDVAKTLKTEIDGVRQRAYTAIFNSSSSAAAAGRNNTSSTLEESGAVDNSEASPSRQRRQSGVLASGDLPITVTITSPAGGTAVYSPLKNGLLTPQQQRPGTGNKAAASGGDGQWTTPFNSVGIAGIDDIILNASGASGEWALYDERPAKARGVYDLDALNDDSGLAGPANPDGIINTASIGEEDAPRAEGEPPANFPSELPRPEALSSADAKDAAALESIVGPYVAACVYSKAWQLREAAFNSIADDVAHGRKSELIDGNSEALRTLTRTASRAQRDKVPTVGTAAVNLFKELILKQCTKCPSREVYAVVGDFLPLLVERASDLNARIRDHSVEALQSLADIKQTGICYMTSTTLKPFKATDNKKAILGRLHLVTVLLPVIGLNDGIDIVSSPATTTSPNNNNNNNASAGYDTKAVATFASAGLKHSAVDVRTAAIDLLKKLAAVSPAASADALVKLLPSDLNPKTKEAVEAALVGSSNSENTSATANTVVDARPASGGANNNNRLRSSSSTSGSHVTTTMTSVSNRTSASHQQQPQRSSASAASEVIAQSSQQQRRSSVTPTSAMNSSRGVNQEQQQQQQARRSSQHGGLPPTSTSSRRSSISLTPAAVESAPVASPSMRSDSATTKRTSAKTLSYQPSQYQDVTSGTPPPARMMTNSPNPTPPAAGSPSVYDFNLEDEDPAQYEEILSTVERKYGPLHPDVAEAASNLAIIYNQKGDSSKALPLYQRALSIWEATHGAFHSDVAHALTDIAVIHLEAGREGEGRPLLERALQIQERLLGPRHPDVVAIRDVLEEA